MGFFLLLLPSLVNSLVYPVVPGVQIMCNRVYGNYRYNTVMFGRPLQIGDTITWNGTVSTTANPAEVNHNLKFTTWSGPTLLQVPFHMRQDVPRQVSIFNNLVYNAVWFRALYGPPIFQLGQPFQVSVKLTASTFEVYSRGALVFTFPIRSKADDLRAFHFTGAATINWIEVQCANPPPGTVTRRPGGPGNGNGNGNGNGHGGHGGHGGHNHGSSSESCEH